MCSAIHSQPGVVVSLVGPQEDVSRVLVGITWSVGGGPLTLNSKVLGCASLH